jgi:hypothetical protein
LFQLLVGVGDYSMLRMRSVCLAHLGIFAVLNFAVPASVAVARPLVIIQPAAFVYQPAPPPKKLFTLAAVRKEPLPARLAGSAVGLNGKLVGLLRRIGTHYGAAVTISSGCRSHDRNRKAGGAKNSYHLRCMAADIKVAGVSEGQLLRFVKTMSGVGGVGTYCGNSVVHIDVGPKRAWTGGCGRHRKG